MSKKILYIHKFLTANLTKIFFMCLIVLFTYSIMIQKDSLLLARQNKEYAYSGIGRGRFEKIQVSNWRNYYGGSMGFDDAIGGRNTVIRISTGIDGGWYGARGDIKEIDLSSRSIRFLVRFDDFNALETFRILLASDSGVFDNYFAFNFKNYFATPIGGEWHEIILDKSEFEVVEGAPDWNSITDIALRVSTPSGVYSRVWFSDLSYVENSDGPLVTLTFDDGFKSNVQAAEIMNKYGFKGTAYIIPSYLETEKYMSQFDVDYLHSLGWDISGHGHTNLRLYSLADAEGDLANMKYYLNTGGYKGREHFSYPNGGYTDSVRSLVAEYFETGRTIDGLAQPQNYFIPTKINAKTVSVKHDVQTVKNWIDDVLYEKSWLILTWHDIVSVPSGDVEYDILKFEEIIKYLSEVGVEVIPFSEAYDRLF